MSSLLRLERKRENSTNPLRIRTFLFLSYSLGIETINTFIHSCTRSLENHIRFQTNMGKSYTRFQTKKPQKPYADGAAHTPPPPFGPNCSLNPYPEFTSDLIQIRLQTSPFAVGSVYLERKVIKPESTCTKMFQTYNNHFLQRFVLKKTEICHDELATFFTECSLECLEQQTFLEF